MDRKDDHHFIAGGHSNTHRAFSKRASFKLTKENAWFCCDRTVDKRLIRFLLGATIILIILVYIIYVLVFQDPDSVQAWSGLTAILAHFSKIEEPWKSHGVGQEEDD